MNQHISRHRAAVAVTLIAATVLLVLSFVLFPLECNPFAGRCSTDTTAAAVFRGLAAGAAGALIAIAADGIYNRYRTRRQ